MLVSPGAAGARRRDQALLSLLLGTDCLVLRSPAQ
jgi:hypothetical protein